MCVHLHRPCLFSWRMLILISFAISSSMAAIEEDDRTLYRLLKHDDIEEDKMAQRRRRTHMVHCIDAKRNVIVPLKKCKTGCCVCKDNDVNHAHIRAENLVYDLKHGYKSDSMPHCAPRSECFWLLRERNGTLPETCPQNQTNGLKTNTEDTDEGSFNVLQAFITFAFLLLLCGLWLLHNNYQDAQEVKQRALAWRQRFNEQFPATVYGNDPECQPQEDEVCCICLDGLEGTVVRRLPCSHVLHLLCFDRWCSHSSSFHRDTYTSEKVKPWLVCPLCKHPAIPDNEQLGPVEHGQTQPAPSTEE